MGYPKTIMENVHWGFSSRPHISPCVLASDVLASGSIEVYLSRGMLNVSNVKQFL